jgi:hypothetical protein
VIFTATADSLRTAVWRQDASGASRPRMLHQASEALIAATIARDGTALALQIWTGVSWDVSLVMLGATPTRAERLLATEAQEGFPRISPDGRWIAYASDETGRYEVYVRSFPDPSTKVQVSNGGGTFPAWSPDGASLYYAGGTRIVEARLSRTPAFRVVARDSAFAAPNLTHTFASGWFEPTRDRNRMLILQPESNRYQLIAVPNWIAEFRARTIRK